HRVRQAVQRQHLLCWDRVQGSQRDRRDDAGVRFVEPWCSQYQRHVVQYIRVRIDQPERGLLPEGMMGQPQLTLYDGGGEHNADLAKTHSRLMQGGSWKKQRIVVVLPAAATIPTKVSLALWNIGFPPNQGVVKIAAEGFEVGDA